MKVFIVDDELHIRRRLRDKIDWRSLGIEEVLVFDDGDLAKEAFPKYMPDILLTDIRMLRMDGITLAHSVLQMKPDTVIILLSAFDDKEYLKSAIDLHVLGYLEKPFGLKQVEELLQKATTEIADVRKSAAISTDSLMQNNLQEFSEIARFLSRFHGSYESVADDLEQKRPGFISQTSYVSVLIHITSDKVDTEDQEIAFLYPEIYQFWKEDNISCLLTETKKPYILVHLANDSKEIIIGQIKAFYDKLSIRLPKMKIHIAAGSIVKNYKLLYQSYQEAAVCIERHFFYNEPILFFRDSKAKVYKFTDEMVNHFNDLLGAKDENGCYIFINQLKMDLMAHDHTLIRNIKNHYFQLILLILEHTPYEQNQTENYSDYYLWETIFYVDSLEKLHECVIELLDHYFAANCKMADPFRNIDAILFYIQLNYANPDLSLTEIAGKHYMSVTYLCMFFKEQTGKTIKSYLIDYRMEKAADLLLHSNLRIAEIAEKTGFSDQYYFSKRFSKYYGQSPGKYKENQL